MEIIIEILRNTLIFIALFYTIPFMVSRAISDGLRLNRGKTIINIHRDLEEKI
jgi:hypothetical protein